MLMKQRLCLFIDEVNCFKTEYEGKPGLTIKMNRKRERLGLTRNDDNITLGGRDNVKIKEQENRDVVEHNFNRGT